MNIDNTLHGISTPLELSVNSQAFQATGFFYEVLAQVDPNRKGYGWIEVTDTWIVSNRHVFLTEINGKESIPDSITFPLRNFADGTIKWDTITLNHDALPLLVYLVYYVVQLSLRLASGLYLRRYPMPKGTIARLMDRGFGFIKTEDGTDLFFHRNDLEGVEFNTLSEGQEVEFEKSQGRDNRPSAVKVKLVGTENSQDEAGVEEESETSKEEPEAGIAEEPEK